MRTTPTTRSRLAAVGATAALVLTLGACGGGDDDQALSAGDRSKASSAALTYVGGGAVTDAADVPELHAVCHSTDWSVPRPDLPRTVTLTTIVFRKAAP